MILYSFFIFLKCEVYLFWTAGQFIKSLLSYDLMLPLSSRILKIVLYNLYMSNLNDKKCIPCEGGIEPLKREGFEKYLDQVKNWQIIDDVELLREFRFDNFKSVMEFVNKVAEVAEKEGHHPNIYIHDWNKVRFTLTTHAIGGLSINDFVMASRIDSITNS